MSGKIERECQVCGEEFKVDEDYINANTVKRLCDYCQKIRSSIKQGESNSRTSMKKSDYRNKPDENLAEIMAHAFIKIEHLRDIMEKRGMLEIFENAMRLPDSVSPAKLEDGE